MCGRLLARCVPLDEDVASYSHEALPSIAPVVLVQYAEEITACHRVHKRLPVQDVVDEHHILQKFLQAVGVEYVAGRLTLSTAGQFMEKFGFPTVDDECLPRILDKLAEALPARSLLGLLDL